jgi:hypothetical protein
MNETTYNYLEAAFLQNPKKRTDLQQSKYINRRTNEDNRVYLRNFSLGQRMLLIFAINPKTLLFFFNGTPKFGNRRSGSII